MAHEGRGVTIVVHMARAGSAAAKLWDDLTAHPF